MAGPEPFRGDYYLWKYVPSLPAAVIFAILFIIATALHIQRLIKNQYDQHQPIRSRLWLIWFIVGGLMEVVGYIARSLCPTRTAELMPYVIQNTLLLLPPVLFAATVYMVLGRIIRHVNGEAYSLVRTRWMTFTFVMGDVISFFVQGGGAGMMVTNDGANADMGEKMIVGGLLIQVIVFGFFIVTAGVFHWRYHHHSVSAVAYREREGQEAEGWKKLLFMLYGVSTLIMVRSLFRVAEFAMGQDGFLLRNEWPLYVFDSVLMFGVMMAFWRWHPNLLQSGAGMMGRERVRSAASLEDLSSGTELKNTAYMRQ